MREISHVQSRRTAHRSSRLHLWPWNYLSSIRNTFIWIDQVHCLHRYFFSREKNPGLRKHPGAFLRNFPEISPFSRKIPNSEFFEEFSKKKSPFFRCAYFPLAITNDPCLTRGCDGDINTKCTVIRRVLPSGEVAFDRRCQCNLGYTVTPSTNFLIVNITTKFPGCTCKFFFFFFSRFTGKILRSLKKWIFSDFFFD